MKKIYFGFVIILFMLYAPGRLHAQGIASAIGGSDATSVVDALGTLYMNDAYKEADDYFFARFAKLLNNYPELKVLFPATVIYLDNVPDYQYSTMLPTLRAALFKDLKKMAADLTKIPAIDTNSCCQLSNDTLKCKQRIRHLDSLFNTENGRVITAALFIADGAINKVSAANVLNNIANYQDIKAATDTVSNILRLLNVVSQSLLSHNSNSTWISADSVARIFTNSVAYESYMKALADSMDSANVYIGTVNIGEQLGKLKTNNDTANLAIYLKTLVSKGRALDTTYHILTTDKNKDDKEQNTAVFIDALDEFFNAAVNYHIISDSIPPATAKANLIYYSLSSGMEISKDVVTKNYQLAVFSTVVLMDSLLETTPNLNRNGKISVTPKSLAKRISLEVRRKEYDPEKLAFLKSHLQSIKDTSTNKERVGELEEILLKADTFYHYERLMVDAKLANDATASKKYNHLISKYAGYRAKIDEAFKKYASIQVDTEALRSVIEKEVSQNIEFKQNLLKFLGFAANVAAADSLPQVIAAIEAVALPPGSTIVKKTNNFSISLQGYVGVPLGFTGAKLGDNVFSRLNAFSPYAPLGLSFNWGLKSRNTANKKLYGSVSLYLSIIDIGGVVGYDFNNSSSKNADTVAVKWQNVFAPGVNLVYGIPGIPLSVGWGFEYQPSLQWVNGSLNTSGAGGYRWQLFVAFDLPFSNLYVSKR